VAETVAAALIALRRLQEKASPPFRIVLHYGQVYLGGAVSLGEDSLLGNEVNFVFRMEKVAAASGLSLLVSQPAQDLIQKQIPLVHLGRKPVPGFEGDFAFYEAESSSAGEGAR
jgi:class 3 adenylate cyclase